MIDARVVFLLLTSLMLVILAGITIATYRKGRKNKMEEPKYRMLDED